MVITFVGRQIWRLVQGQGINLPKLLFMGCALFTHYLVFYSLAVSFLVAEALETAYHTVQYQGWMIHYQRRRFPEVKRVALKWAGLSLLYGTVAGVVEVYSLLDHPWAVWLFAPFTMLVLFHYYVDGLIWRFRQYPELSRVLFSQEKKVEDVSDSGWGHT
jgi:hypothetical protein